ncbi:hypothetical protein ABD68_12225 [Bacillus endophyticus]|uniref:hypothetical protein n=1 Tax=Priestia endophytica TaxID=135735 RepID=UPI0018CDEE2B|nr:hypothetical protein [Priestia endophytica]MBG9812332.1 hypothetical protein [Priestia endophytica]
MNGKEFIELMYPTTWVFKKLEVNGEEAVMVHDSNGQIITEKEFYKMMVKAKRFYDSQKDNPEEIEKFNRYMDFNNLRGMTHDFSPLSPGYAHKVPEVEYEFKEFNPNLQRKWSCKCGLCGEKISSDKDKGYFLLNFDKYIREMNIDTGNDWFTYRRACSLDCAKAQWKMLFKEWIFENDYEEFFIIE